MTHPVDTASHPVHGGLDPGELRSLGLSPEKVLDFSSSINPLGAPPGVREAISRVNLAAYPDSRCLELREALSGRLGVPPECILAGNGSTELIHLAARAYLGAGDPAFIFAPAFGEYEAACRIQGVEPTPLTAGESQGFRWDLPAALEAIRAARPRLVFLCNPNNPTGVYLPRQQVEAIAEATSESGLLVLDEAYVSFVDSPWESLPLLDRGNVVLLRSMTKDYALTGLRLGYMLASPDRLERTSRLQTSWSVNALAQAAGIASLQDAGHLERGREAAKASKEYLLSELGEMGLAAAPSEANFLLVRVGDASGLRRELLKRGLCVRDCASFGLPEHIRIGMRNLEDCQRLALAMREVLGHE